MKEKLEEDKYTAEQLLEKYPVASDKYQKEVNQIIKETQATHQMYKDIEIRNNFLETSQEV